MTEEKTTNQNEKGGISVSTENIFPVIKRWLYSEKEIFLREIVSNACDAITKVKRLRALGKCEIDDAFRVDIKVDPEKKTLTVSDNGIGMNLDEVKRYICEIALSGALEFIEKYEGDGETEGAGIIGHFGLGFYSAFMVSSNVEIVTSSIDGSPTVRWNCTEEGSYEIDFPEEQRARGTDIIMHISPEGEEYLSYDKLKEILRKYCAFMPVEIYFTEEGKAHDGDDKCINTTEPLWQKNPSDCTEEEYNKFYTGVFSDWREPLFHIHINADYPLNFKGILYFPKMQNEYEPMEGQVKLFDNQVFVADNIKEVVPDYLLMLRGVLDCPELPLNVSRSYLQNNAYVSKVSAHIVKKVADKINSLYSTEREKYEGFWKDIKLFVEYGCLKDTKFFDRVKKSILFETTAGKFVTLDEYKESAKDKNDGKVFYCTDPVTQAQYVSLYEGQGVQVVVLNKVLDTQFIEALERDADSGVKFLSVDSGVDDTIADKSLGAHENSDMEALFREASANEKLKVEFAHLRDTSIPAMLNIKEDQRRFADMMKIYGGALNMNGPVEMTLVLNSDNTLVQKLEASENEEAKKAAAKEVYTLALLSQRPLTADELKAFLSESFRMVEETL